MIGKLCYVLLLTSLILLIGVSHTIYGARARSLFRPAMTSASSLPYFYSASLECYSNLSIDYQPIITTLGQRENYLVKVNHDMVEMHLSMYLLEWHDTKETTISFEQLVSGYKIYLEGVMVVIKGLPGLRLSLSTPHSMPVGLSTTELSFPQRDQNFSMILDGWVDDGETISISMSYFIDVRLSIEPLGHQLAETSLGALSCPAVFSERITVHTFPTTWMWLTATGVTGIAGLVYFIVQTRKKRQQYLEPVYNNR